jgi:hypothetical protein
MLKKLFRRKPRVMHAVVVPVPSTAWMTDAERRYHMGNGVGRN